MNRNLIKTSEDKKVRYYIYGNDYNMCTKNVLFRIAAINQNNIELGSCILDVEFKTHTREKPATYNIKVDFYQPNKTYSVEEFVCNVFDCVERFIEAREMRHCKITGHFGNNKAITEALTAKGYELKNNMLEKSIYMPYYRTMQERANVYKIFNEENENQL